MRSFVVGMVLMGFSFGRFAYAATDGTEAPPAFVSTHSCDTYQAGAGYWSPGWTWRLHAWPHGPAVRVAPSSKGLGGSGFGKLWEVPDGKWALLAAVLGAMILPPILYAVDDEAPESVRWSHACAQMEGELYGGYLGGLSSTLEANSPEEKGFAGGSLRLAQGFVGVGGDFEYGVDSRFSQGSAYVFVRPQPRAHIEINLELGYRYLRDAPGEGHGFEFGMRTRYLFVPEWRTLGLELRPAFYFHSLNAAVDLRLDAGLLIPLGENFQMSLGGRVFSFGPTIHGGGFGRLGFRLGA